MLQVEAATVGEVVLVTLVVVVVYVEGEVRVEAEIEVLGRDPPRKSSCIRQKVS